MSYAIAAYSLVGVVLGAYALHLVSELRSLRRTLGDQD
jgi:hypothetical protein